jgi:hypothetical protein
MPPAMAYAAIPLAPSHRAGAPGDAGGSVGLRKAAANGPHSPSETTARHELLA